MIKVVAYVNILDFYYWAHSERSKGWNWRTKMVNDQLLVYMERENQNGKDKLV